MTTHTLTYLAIALGLLGSFAYADKFPFAEGTFDANNKLTQWSLDRVRTYRNDTIGKLKNDDGSEKSVPQKDAAADPNKLKGYPSHDVETKSFTTDIDLTYVSGLVYVAIHVDDIANLTATEIDDAGEPIGTPIPYNVKGSALWRAEKSYQEFPDPIPGGKKYRLNLDYTNTVNLTKQYNGPIDYDGVNVFLMHHPAVDLDVDSDNTEGFKFTWGDDKEDKIEASPSLPGKIIAVPIEPDADNDGIPDYKDFGGITPGPDKQFVQMVVHLPPNYDPETATVTFDYPMSATTNGSSIEPPNSGFRIWTKNGHVSRSLDAIPVAPPAAPDPAPGYLVKDGDPILWKNLAANCEEAEAGRYPGPALILYLETVITYKGGSLSTSQPEQIQVTAKNGSNSDDLETEDVVNITVRCTGGVKIFGPKAIMVNDNNHNRDASGNQIDKWDFTNDRTGTLDPDVLPIAIEITALDQDVIVILSSEAMKGLGEPGTPVTGGLIDGVFPGYADPQGEDEITDEDGQSKKGWIRVDPATPCKFEVKKHTTFKQNLYIEGQRHSATVDDVVIKLETTGEGIEAGDEKTCIATTESEHKMTVYQVDLDVDSDNDSILTNTDKEDQIEASATLPGKVIFTSLLTDTNYDGIPDYQNGVNEKPVDKGAYFVPIRLSLPEPFDPLSTEIILSYDEALFGAAPPTSGMRIWTADATSPRSVEKNLISKDAPIIWSDLLKKTKMEGRSVVLFIETINSLGKPIAGNNEITFTAKQRGAIDTVDKVNLLLLYGEIEKVISDQIAGNECNSLPSKAYGLQPNNPMLMATRTGKDARLQIVADVPALHAAEIRVGIRVKNNPTVILGSAAALPGGAKTPLAFTAVDGKKLYEVVIGYDKNHDAVMTNDEVVNTFEKTPRTDPGGKPYTGGDTTFTYLDKILIVTRNDYIAARKETEAYGTGLIDSRTFPLGNDLLRAFATGDTVLKGANPPVGGFIVDANVIPSLQGLSHPLGRIWNTSNQATTHKIVYPNKSKMSKKVLDSPVFTSLVDRIISANKSSLLATATTTWKTSPPIAFVDKNLAFGSGFLLSDLHLALGKCNAIGEVKIKYRSAPGGKIEVSSVNCYGSITDLYDWAYGIEFDLAPDLPKQAARTQAGHATLSTKPWPSAGRIFFTEVEFVSGFMDWNNTIY